MAQQQQASGPNWDGTHGGAKGGSLPQPAPGAQDQANSAAMNGGSGASGSGSMGGDSAMSGSAAMASNGGAMVGDQTATNPAPSAYPRCTHKGQDRCRTKGG